MNEIIKHRNEIIETIKKEILERNIDILEFSQKLDMTGDEFVELFNNPTHNVSFYIRILEEVRNERSWLWIIKAINNFSWKKN